MRWVLTSAVFVLFRTVNGGASPAPGDTLERIQGPPGWTATVLCTGVRGADGMSMSPSGNLFVLSETDGSLCMVDSAGTVFTVAGGMDHPEGIAVDECGNIYVTEDALNGRAIRISTDGEWLVLADSLLFPEGIALDESGRTLVTYSSAETGALPPFSTGVLEVDGGKRRTIFSNLYLWSLSELILSPDGHVYACNETSGFPLVNESVIRIDTSGGSWDVLARGLHSCEGICSTPDSFWPLYIAEEDTGCGCGRVSTVDSTGHTSTFATGFLNIEDVVVDTSGSLYVSEDTSGMVILLRKGTDR